MVGVYQGERLVAGSGFPRKSEGYTLPLETEFDIDAPRELRAIGIERGIHLCGWKFAVDAEPTGRENAELAIDLMLKHLMLHFPPDECHANLKANHPERFRFIFGS